MATRRTQALPVSKVENTTACDTKKGLTTRYVIKLPVIPVFVFVGVPDVLVALFDGAREFAPHKMMTSGGGGGKSAQSSSGGLCNTLKTLLMSSSYRVRSGTARLIASLCNDSRLSEKPAAAQGHAATGGGGRKGACLFFRETLVAAGATGEINYSICTSQQDSASLRNAFSHISSYSNNGVVAAVGQ